MTTTAPSLLTPAAEAEVGTALLRLAHVNAEAVEHVEALPPVAPKGTVYRLGALEVAPLHWEAGAALVSQSITVWTPSGAPTVHPEVTERIGGREHVKTSLSGPHARLGEVSRDVRQAILSDGTKVSTGTYSVEVFPFLPLILERPEQVARVALSDRHRGREVGKVGPVEGKPEHRSQRVEVAVTVRGNALPVITELEGKSTSAGFVSKVDVLGARADHIGSGSFATATPSHDRNVVALAVTLQWRER